MCGSAVGKIAVGECNSNDGVGVWWIVWKWGLRVVVRAC